MQTFSIRWFKESSVALFVMPRLIGWARFHDRKYVDKARMIAPLETFKDFCNTMQAEIKWVNNLVHSHSSGSLHDLIVKANDEIEAEMEFSM